MSLIQGETGEWEVVIGLEIHAQVVSDAKLFSGASTAFGAEPNTQVSLVDAAMPGMLPGAAAEGASPGAGLAGGASWVSSGWCSSCCCALVWAATEAAVPISSKPANRAA